MCQVISHTNTRTWVYESDTQRQECGGHGAPLQAPGAIVLLKQNRVHSFRAAHPPSINHIGEVASRCVSLGRLVLSVITLPIKRRRGWGGTAVAVVGVTPPACISFLKWGSSWGAEKGGRMVLSWDSPFWPPPSKSGCFCCCCFTQVRCGGSHMPCGGHWLTSILKAKFERVAQRQCWKLSDLVVAIARVADAVGCGGGVSDGGCGVWWWWCWCVMVTCDAGGSVGGGVWWWCSCSVVVVDDGSNGVVAGGCSGVWCGLWWWCWCCCCC